MGRPVLIAGSGGMLGTALRHVCAEKGFTAFAPDENAFDITSPEAVAAAVGSFVQEHPDGAVVNAAAFTNVDAAEDNRELAFLVNQFGASLVAETAAAKGLPFVHVSTDFVFDGTKDGPYTEDDEPDPLSVYGASKLAGELAVEAVYPTALIVRTAWVFGLGGANFPTKILDRARDADSIRVVSDEVGSPTYTVDLAAAILDLLGLGASGLFHLAGSGWCSRDELAREVLRLAGRAEVEVLPVSSATIASKAPRPANSVLDCSKAAALGVRMPDWREALGRFITTLS
jgi:dTDP-4-dehydrorhamnose reductase